MREYQTFFIYFSGRRLPRIFFSRFFPVLVILFLSGSFSAEAEGRSERELFISVIQSPQTLSSREAIRSLVSDAVKTGVKVLFVQIYRGDRAWFPSRLSDDRPYQSALKNVGEDPLAFLIREAHAAGLEVHAWMNALSLSENTEAPILKKYGPSVLTRKPGEKIKLEDYMIDHQYFLEPSDERVRSYLLGLIEEVLSAYSDLDGLQIDYIRYPDSQPFYGYAPGSLARFKAASGAREVDESTPGWKDWRRDQVTELVRQLSEKARALHPGIVFSTTGCAPYSRAYHEAFQDWAVWIKIGLVDFVTMMSYPLDPLDFEENIQSAESRAGGLEKVNIGVGAYKMLERPELFGRQWAVCEGSGARGCAVFHYGNLLENPELENILIDIKKP